MSQTQNLFLSISVSLNIKARPSITKVIIKSCNELLTRKLILESNNNLNISFHIL